MNPRLNGEFSARTRLANLQQFKTDLYDILVVGGGITGAGIARDAAMRGLKVALIDKGDFASGTSSKSSKLVHGGVRYLELFEFGLVFEASRERRTLWQIAPHLVRPLPFLFPVYRDARWPAWMIDIGLWMYDGPLSQFQAARDVFESGNLTSDERDRRSEY
jgi:glycerol-3-phosphate dehydrogenase